MYKPNSNIFTKSDVTIGGPLSVYLYGNDAGTHAVTTVHNPTNDYLTEAANPQSITYTLFNKIETITQTKIEEEEEHRYGLSYTYGPDNARKTAITTKDRRVLKTKIYIGADYEIEILEDGSIRKLHYITGGDGLFAIYEWTSSDIGESFEKRMYYIHKDYLGSYETITNNSGIILEKLSFDPWGRKRNPVDWTYTPSPFASIFDRGYTGHEHMEAFGLINMNGRVYDPWLGRMLSPDPYVQAPTYSQNFNRYSYAYNNPLKYSDPDGQWVHLVVGAAIGGVLNLGINAMQGNIDNFADGLYAFGIGAAAGALAAGIGAGVGTLAAGSGSFGFGVSAGLTASGFGAGAAVGAASGFTSGFILGTGNSLLDDYNIGQSLGRGLESGGWGAAGGAVLGGISGGIRATKLGNDFWTGRSEFKAVNVKRSLLSGSELDNSFGGGRTGIKSIPKPNRTWDYWTNIRTRSLQPQLQSKTIDFINGVENNFGVRLRITSAYRSFTEQSILYSSGRNLPGKIVTNAMAGESYHNYGLAFDVVEMQNGQPIWEPLSSSIGNYGRTFGFEWGGNFRSIYDPAHFQLTHGLSIDNLLWHHYGF